MYDFLILRHSHSCIALKNAITYFLLKVYLPPDSVWYTEKQVESGTITVESGQVRYTEKQVESMTITVESGQFNICTGGV